MVDRDIAVVKDRVAHHDRRSSIEPWREVVDERSPLVEYQIEAQPVVTLLIAIHRQTIMLVNHD